MKNKKLILIISAILAAFFVVTCATTSSIDFAGLGKGSDKVPLNSNVLTGTLPNGLCYYILENSLPENRAHLALVVNAGSVLEREDERGFAHFVEHLAFNGTARFPNLELIEYLRSLGMRFGADANAYTSYDETVYHFDVPIENVNGVKRIPDRALAILDDWTYAVTFSPQEVESESRVVLEEFRTRSGAMERVRKITLPILFSGSAYADRSPIGLEHVIENSTPDQLKAFYDRWYTSDNMALVFVGDFDGKALEAELSNHFNMTSTTQKVNRPVYNLPPPKNGNFQVEIITDPELTSASYNIYYKQKQGHQRGTLSYYRGSIIEYLIDIMLTLRFEEEMSNPESAAIDSWAGVWRWSSSSRFFTMGTQPKKDNVEQALRELLLEKESVRRFGFTQSELKRAKLSLVSYMERLLSEKNRMESRSFVRGFTSNFLFGEDIADIEWEVNAVNRLLPGISLREVSAVTKNFFSADDCVVFLIAPQAEADTLPSKERIREIFRETKNARISRRVDTSLSDELLEKVPAAGTIISETRDTETGSYTIKLENGATVILKETTNKNNEIVFYAVANGGTANATEQTIVSVNLLSEMLNVSGLGPYSRTDLVNKLTGKQVSLNYWTSNYSRGFQGSSTTKDIKTLFEMIHLFFTHPALDERAIAAMIDQYRTNLAHQEESPGRFFSRELTRIIYNNHPLFKPLESNDMDKVSVQQARSFLDRCLNPGDYTFIFTGNFNQELMRENTANYIASIPQAQGMNTWNDPGIPRPAQGRRTIYKGIDDRCIVYLGWFARGPAIFNEQRNQVAAVLSEYLDIVLTDEIRENLGGVYSISAGASVSTIPAGEYRITVYFVCNPERTEELITAARKSVSDVINQPINMATFNKATEALIQQHERSMQNNLHIAQSYANSSVLFNTPLNRLNQRPNAIRAVTPRDMQALCREMLANGPLELVLLPEGNR